MGRFLFYGCMIFFLGGCSSFWEDQPPEIIDLVRDIAIQRGDSLVLSMKYIDARSRSGRTLSLQIGAGNNYSLHTHTIIPDAGFTGDLSVPVWVDDGVATSERDTIRVRVITEIHLMPLAQDNFWVYTDLDHHGRTAESRLVVHEPWHASGFSGESFVCQWDHLEDDITLYYGTDSAGATYLLGAASPQDTLWHDSLPMVRFPYPVTQGDSWEYPDLGYSLSDSAFVLFFRQAEAIDTAAFVSVPAGIFSTIQYRLTIPYEQFLRGAGVRFPPTMEKRVPSQDIFIYYYYAPGIGLVQYKEYEGERLRRQKTLSSYEVH
ncbi:hypothetical protein [Chitinivibrio alkaliphilus]|uniref:Lipoprotein n=1 Tax=Chitinivibrio alkaliphilus ACht1 TaxID=1313304 RepID=U7D521_9BACT|nr:hypothetical protein [Chitinivibrio alkaliphilus]ERP31038.1 hypothetical protein CALK_2116 [Chitinivibrio alkaliphilus ACht1]